MQVSISGDTLAVNSYEDSGATTITNGTTVNDIGYKVDSGAVYVYRRSGNNWAQEAYIKAVNSEEYNYFSESISISGDTLVVGAANESSNATIITNGTSVSEPGLSSRSGAVYIYRNNARLFKVTEIFPIITSDSISFKWNKTGGTALGYGVNFELGIVTPPLCSLSMDYNLGNNNELLLEGLTADTDYSLRFCVYDSSNQFVEDKIIYLKTNP